MRLPLAVDFQPEIGGARRARYCDPRVLQLGAGPRFFERCVATVEGAQAAYDSVAVIEERFDIAIRAKPEIEDVAGLVAKTLGNPQRVLVVRGSDCAESVEQSAKAPQFAKRNHRTSKSRPRLAVNGQGPGDEVLIGVPDAF